MRWEIEWLIIEALSKLLDMCGADISDVSELEGIENEGDKKTRSERKYPDKTHIASPPAGD